VRLERSDAVRNDLDEIWLFIAQDNQRAADRVIDRLDDAVLRLLDFPHMGVAREDLALGLRGLRVDNFIIFYRTLGDVLSLDRILHARLDVTSEMF